jgi:LDH2 family malate/lactate/ureidoglycolate dehydrogenase
MLVKLDTLKQTALTVLAHSGYPADEAEILLDVLLYAQLRGNNQGIVKLIGAGMPRDPNAQPVRVVRETKISALLDGGRGAGMVAMRRAADLAVEKAREHDIGIVGTNNTNTSTGAIGYYVNIIAQAGFIGFAFSGSGEYVAMHGSYEPLFGTNPLAIAVPTAGDTAVVFDMATSAIARYGIIEAQTAGRALPPDVALDRDGNPTTDATAALAGAIRTFGGYKGAALSFMVEVFTHALVETSPTPEGKKTDFGNLVIAINPALLTDAETFKARISTLVARVKGSKKLPGVDDIMVPGERGNALWSRVLAAGEVEIDDSLWAALQARATA